jgi:hypothetical protein
MNKSEPALPYVVIDLEPLVKNGNSKPFKTVLNAPNPKDTGGEKKTLFNTFFYCFGAAADGTTYYKIGETFSENTYHSKKRFCPFIDYEGLFQIHHYGKLFQKLIGCYLRLSFKESEWYTNCKKQLNELVDALNANEHFQPEKPRVMTNVKAFATAFTGRHKSTLDDYLSLFRVRYKGALYRLCEANVAQRLTIITSKEYLVEGTPTAPAPPADESSTEEEDAADDEESSE